MILQKLNNLIETFIDYKNKEGFNDDKFVKFNKINKLKKEKIILCAIEEFNSKNYDEASTNSIIKKASIGKGMLFYYFKSKENLFKYLIFYSIEKFLYLIKEKFENINNFNNLGFEEKLFLLFKIKIEIYRKNLLITNFIIKYFSNPPEILKYFICKLYNFMIFLSPDFIIDEEIVGKIKENIDINKVKETILFVIKGFEEKILLNVKNLPAYDINFEKISKEFIEYLTILRKGFEK
ncbi:MAG: TetR/AcrR family transcriptional regulator [Spirochaetes bacterium]|nr:TetR/AcrR family transcriptional regulator [Spirochaetota bacterium]